MSGIKPAVLAVISAEARPRVDRDGVPRCAEDDCISYDGKRCVLMGSRPSDICEPAVVDMAFALEKAARRA